MADVGTIAAALSSVKTATDIVNLFRQGDLSLQKAEQKMKLADLVGALAEIKTQLADVQHVILERDNRISELEKKLELRGKLIYDKIYYWVEGTPTNDGPFCQRCYDSDGRLIRLQDVSDGYWECKSCKNGFEDKRVARHIPVRAETDYDPFDRD